MSFLDKILRRKPKPGAQTPDLVTDIAKEIADEKPSWARAYREFRQYRLDARIRRELAKSRAYAISSRPRTPQAGTKVVGKTPRYLELSNGMRVKTIGRLRNPVLAALRQKAA